MSEITQSELEFQRSWQGAAEKSATLKSVVLILKEESGQLFANERDKEAKLVRELAKKFERMQEEASRELHVFIDENARRRTHST